MIPLLGRREPALWAGALLVAWALLAATGFASRDPDSAFYAAMSARLAHGDAARVIAPEWGGLWNGTGLWQEHPIGIYLVPIALIKAGYPDGQAAYAAGIAAGLACLLLLARLARAAEPSAGRSALVLLQLVPAAFVFRVRANQFDPGKPFHAVRAIKARNDETSRKAVLGGQRLSIQLVGNEHIGPHALERQILEIRGVHELPECAVIGAARPEKIGGG